MAPTNAATPQRSQAPRKRGTAPRHEGLEITYERLSTKDKQDPTLSFPSQRQACEAKTAELNGRIVCDFTDQEAGRRDDRTGWSELVREAKDGDARRFDTVVIYATSRLSRDLFRALAYERELAVREWRSSTRSQLVTRRRPRAA